MISPYPTNIKAIKATPNGVYLYAQIYITFPCNVDGNNYSLCSDIEGRKIIYDLNLNEGVSLRRDVLYGDIIINENGEVVSIETEYNTEKQRYETYVKDEYGNKYTIVSSSKLYPMNYGIDFKGDKLLMDYYEYDMDANKLTIPQVMYLLNKTTKEVSTIRYPTINNKPANSMMRGEMDKGKIYLHALHPDFHIPNIITSQNLNGELLWYISSDERAILDFAIDELDRVYVMGIWVDILPPQYPPNASYIARYIQGGITLRWMIYKDTTTDNQIISPNQRTKPFISIVKDGEGNGVDGVRVVWETNANWIEKEYDITNGGGLSSNTLMINQVPPYEYRITAICNECRAQMSSVTFTCCGKLPNDDFKQYDVRWKYELYNTTTPLYQKTIGQVGCALTAMATLINYYARNFPELNISATNPKDLNDILENRLNPKGYNSNHDIDFTYIKSKSISNGKIIYLQRKDYSYPLSESSIQEIHALIDEDLTNNLPVIIVVRRTNENETEEWKHFMLVVGKCRDKYIISDPASLVEELFDIKERIKLKNKSFIGPVIGIRRFSKLKE